MITFFMKNNSLHWDYETSEKMLYQIIMIYHVGITRRMNFIDRCLSLALKSIDGNFYASRNRIHTFVTN